MGRTTGLAVAARRMIISSALEIGMGNNKQSSTEVAEEAARLLGSAFRQELDLSDPKVQRELKKASRLVQNWTAGLADEAAERASAQRHAEAAAKQYERATAGIAKPNPIVVIQGNVRSTVERVSD